MVSHKILLNLAMVLLCSSSLVSAQDDPYDDDDDDDDELQLILGLGLESETNIYKDIGDESGVFPILDVRYKNLWIRRGTIGITAFENDIFSVSPIVNLGLGGGGYSADDADSGSTLYDGLEERESATEAGVQLDFELSEIDWGVSYVTDVSSTHKGSIFGASVSYDYELMNDSFMLTPSLDLEWVSQEYNQYYYGITAKQANAERDIYSADSGVNIGLSLLGIYKLNNYLFFSRLAVDKYDSSITDSPLVDDDQGVSLAVGIGYEF